jgi:shikimate kinase
LVRQLGTVVHLEADEETLFRRINRRTLPALAHGKSAGDPDGIAAGAPATYRAAADIEVDTALLTHDEVAKRILNQIEN